jgi:predicted nucleic acid-binding Zn ribbon protein
MINTSTELTGKKLKDLLPKVFSEISKSYRERPELILALWSEVIGEKLAPMTQAVSFSEGVLTVKVKNSTLHSLLVQHEKAKLLKKLREKVPSTEIRNIIFRIG